jgi:DNA-binding transcriptional ArsR family regulator
MRNKKIAQNSFSALADDTRLKIFLKIIELSSYASLGDNPILAENTAKHLTEIFHLAKSTVSHHIEILLASKLIFVINKNKFTYLFPNFVKFQEINEFINTQIMPYHLEGEFVLCAEMYLKKPVSKVQELIDYLVIHDFRGTRLTMDPGGKHKIYFKISGFIEPFYLLIYEQKLSVYSLKKNIKTSEKNIENLIAIINKIY